jgi:hypothetical protein
MKMINSHLSLKVERCVQTRHRLFLLVGLFKVLCFVGVCPVVPFQIKKSYVFEIYDQHYLL